MVNARFTFPLFEKLSATLVARDPVNFVSIPGLLLKIFETRVTFALAVVVPEFCTAGTMVTVLAEKDPDWLHDETLDPDTLTEDESAVVNDTSAVGNGYADIARSTPVRSGVGLSTPVPSPLRTNTTNLDAPVVSGFASNSKTPVPAV